MTLSVLNENPPQSHLPPFRAGLLVNINKGRNEYETLGLRSDNPVYRIINVYSDGSCRLLSLETMELRKEPQDNLRLFLRHKEEECDEERAEKDQSVDWETKTLVDAGDGGGDSMTFRDDKTLRGDDDGESEEVERR